MIFTVSRLTAEIKTILEKNYSGIKTEGEISNCRFSSTGHLYFSLKDSSARIQCVLFRSALSRVPFMPEDGQVVVASGSLSVYPPSGNYQLVCTGLSFAGEGQILQLLEKRKQKFAELGYFDASRKKPLPRYPRRIAIVTSPNGAALMDILNITGRRNKKLTLQILPAPVQGSVAGKKIAAQIDRANRYALGDVLIVGRGGGSLEDLLPFSEECVIEAIYRSDIPVISAVGHEIDFALSDFVADLRAPTPSAAAELVSGEMDSLMSSLKDIQEELMLSIDRSFFSMRQRLESAGLDSLKTTLLRRMRELKYQVKETGRDMTSICTSRISLSRSTIRVAYAQLTAMSPENVLRRGYALVRSKNTGALLTSTKDTSKNELLDITLYDGSIDANVHTLHHSGKKD